MTQSPPVSLAELARLIDAELEGDGHLAVSGPASLAQAGGNEISFLAQPRYQSQLKTTAAGAVVVAKDLVVERSDLNLLRCADPNVAFTQVIRAFTPVLPPAAIGVHPSAVVDPEATVEAGASIGPLCQVAAGAKVASGARLIASVNLGPGASVGTDSVLHPGVVLYDGVHVGERTLIHAGSVLGSDGFGFEPAPPQGWTKVPQCGTVEVGNDVEIGANVTIDRARFGATRIGNGVKIDNQVHVAHNVVVGDNALLIAQVGVSGSTTIGTWAILGGKVGVAGHLEIGAQARVGGGSDVFTDVPPKIDFLGSPARPRMETLRAQAGARRIPRIIESQRDLASRCAALEARLAELENQTGADA